MNFSTQIILNRLISPVLTATLPAHSVVHSHFVEAGHFLGRRITMEVKENISLIFLVQSLCCDLPNEAIWIKVLTLSGMRKKDNQVWYVGKDW
jgi:hypothetical protein